ncbi:MAG: OmpA family protein [Elusimicrobia bacterium]|nr:OmpA family protein [Elusimicrobiota bacterium]
MNRLLPLAAVTLLCACAGARLEKQKKELDETREKAGALLVQVKEKSDEADAAKAAKAEVEAKLADAEGKLAIANSQLESLRNSNKQLADSSTAGKTELGGKLNAAVAEKDALAAKLADAQKEKLALERTKGIYRSARDKALAEVAALKAERDALAAAAQAAKDAEAKAAEERSARAAKVHDEMGAVADAVLKEMQAGLVTASERAGGFDLTVGADALFDEGGAKVRGDGAALLEKLGKALKGLGARELRVSAHADNAPVKKGLLGGYDDAWGLTSARAAAVARWLHEHAGLDPARLRAEGDGEFRPLKPNDSAEGRAANRRVTISVDALATP